MTLKLQKFLCVLGVVQACLTACERDGFIGRTGARGSSSSPTEQNKPDADATGTSTQTQSNTNIDTGAKTQTDRSQNPTPVVTTVTGQELPSGGGGPSVQSSLQPLVERCMSVSGTFGCTLTNTGLVKCWNSFLSTGSNQLAPVQVETFANISLANVATSVTASGPHACASLEGGGAQCFGMPRPTGVTIGKPAFEVGPHINPSANYKQVASFVGPKEFAQSPLAAELFSDGKLSGGQTYGSHPMGIGKAVVYPLSTYVGGSASRTCSLTQQGELECHVVSLVLGGQGAVSVSSKKLRDNVVDFVELSRMGISMVDCAVFADRKLECWGYNYGHDTEKVEFRQAGAKKVNVSNARAVAKGDSIRANTLCYLSNDGDVYCTKSRDYDLVGDVPFDFVKVEGVSDAVEISGNCAKTRAGAIKCFYADGLGTSAVPNTKFSSFLVPVENAKVCAR